jgi:hypothetical protein
LVGLGEPSVGDVSGQPVPVVCGTAKALVLSGKVFRLIKCQPLIILCDGGPLLEGLDIKDKVRVCLTGAVHGTPSQSGTLTPSTISRFCASDIPAE